MDKKYELIKSDIPWLYRIKALRDFSNVKRGNIGGYIENEYNLSHEGNCWIYNNAKIYDNARVYDDVKAYNNATIYEDVQIYDNVRIYGNSQIYGNAEIYGNAQIYEDAQVYGNAKVFGNVQVFDNTEIFGFAKMYGNAVASSGTQIYGNAQVYGNAKIYGEAEIYGNAKIDKGIHTGVIDEEFKKIIYIRCKKRLITVYEDLNNIIKCNIGCQTRMTLENLLQRIYEDGGMKPHREEYIQIMKNARSLLR